jgi:hypothetical protein
MVQAPAFQAGDAGSIPAVRSKKITPGKNAWGYFFGSGLFG